MSKKTGDLVHSGNLSVGEALNNVQRTAKVRVKRKTPAYPRKWVASADYELFSEGIVLNKSPDKLEDKLGPQCLFLFRHVQDGEGDDIVAYGEDKDRPLWIGVLKPHNYPEDMYYLPTQDQEKIIYKDRSAKTMPKDFHLEDGSPYWVDSYYHKKGRERKNKTRHTQKINEKRKRQEQQQGEAEVDQKEGVVVVSGLLVDGKTFFAPSDKLTKTLKKGDWLDVKKVARRTMVTSNLAKRIPEYAGRLKTSILSGAAPAPTGATNKRVSPDAEVSPKKKTKQSTYQQDASSSKMGSNFMAKRWKGPIAVEDMPQEMIDYITDQYEQVRQGERGVVADAMWAAFDGYAPTKNPVHRVAENSVGDLLYSYHTYLQQTQQE